MAIKEYADMSAMTRGSFIEKLKVYETNYLNLNPKKEKRYCFSGWNGGSGHQIKWGWWSIFIRG